MDGRGLQARRLGHPPRGAAGRRDEQHRRVLRGRRGADHPDRRRLAGARAARDDRQPRGHRRPHGVGLRGRRDDVARPSPRGRCRRARPRGQLAHPLGELRLELGGLRPVGPERSRRRPARARAAPCSAMPASSCASGAAPSSSPAAAASSPTGRHVEPLRSASASTCTTPARARAGESARHALRAGDRVGDLEADAEHRGQVVRPLAHHAVPAAGVVLLDPRHQPGEPVRRQQQVQRARGAQLVPGAHRLAGAPRAQPDRAERGRAGRGRSPPARPRRARAAAARRASLPTCRTRRRYAVSAASPEGPTGVGARHLAPAARSACRAATCPRRARARGPRGGRAARRARPAARRGRRRAPRSRVSGFAKRSIRISTSAANGAPDLGSRHAATISSDRCPRPPTTCARASAELTLRDAHRLKRRLDRARRHPDPKALRKLEADVERAEARVAKRRADVPAVSYPPELPVSGRREDLLAAIRDNQVVVVAGETGSGKTTQLPKLCLELGRGVRGTIAHTQPRRLAARTVAERIADELNVPLGGAVGYAVRFSDRSSRGHARAADDRRPAAGRDPPRPAAAPLRHGDRRRGARAQPQHRLPARLPRADPAASGPT